MATQLTLFDEPKPQWITIGGQRTIYQSGELRDKIQKLIEDNGKRAIERREAETQNKAR